MVTAKYLSIPIANDSYAMINASGLTLIENAVTYLLGNTKFISTSTGIGLHKMAGVYFDGQTIHNDAKLNLQVYDATGRMMISSIKNISMSQSSKGIYFVKSNSGSFKIVL